MKKNFIITKMMSTLYNTIIHLYIIIIYIASVYNQKAKKWINGRRNIFPKLKNEIQYTKDIVWFHCASLGEFEQGKTIIEKYKLKYPKHKLLLTFFSPSGFEFQKNCKIVDWVFYLPADTKKNAEKFIEIVNPIKVIFVKYEFWYNYINTLYKKNIPILFVSTIFRKNQLFFKNKWIANQLKKISHFYLQDKKSQDLLSNIEIQNSTICGDSRFDNIIKNSSNKKEFPLIKIFCKTRPTIIFGSIWPKDFTIINQFIKAHNNYNYIIAPHELTYVNYLQKKTNSQLYSEIQQNNINLKNIIIIDNIGMLSTVYKYGKISYIGGGFNNGIHNILEPIIFGKPVIFGPKHQKFTEANINNNFTIIIESCFK